MDLAFHGFSNDTSYEYAHKCCHGWLKFGWQITEWVIRSATLRIYSTQQIMLQGMTNNKL